MSLHYHFGKVADYQRLCWMPDGTLNPVTKALVWRLLHIDIREITEDNVDEVLFRSRCISVVSGPPLYAHDGQRVIPRDFTREEIVSHIGLRTNVVTKSRKQFLKSCALRLERLVTESLYGEAQQKDQYL